MFYKKRKGIIEKRSIFIFLLFLQAIFLSTSLLAFYILDFHTPMGDEYLHRKEEYFNLLSNIRSNIPLKKMTKKEFPNNTLKHHFIFEMTLYDRISCMVISGVYFDEISVAADRCHMQTTRSVDIRVRKPNESGFIVDLIPSTTYQYETKNPDHLKEDSQYKYHLKLTFQYQRRFLLDAEKEKINTILKKHHDYGCRFKWDQPEKKLTVIINIEKFQQNLLNDDYQALLHSDTNSMFTLLPDESAYSVTQQSDSVTKQSDSLRVEIPLPNEDSLTGIFHQITKQHDLIKNTSEFILLIFQYYDNEENSHRMLYIIPKYSFADLQHKNENPPMPLTGELLAYAKFEGLMSYLQWVSDIKNTFDGGGVSVFDMVSQFIANQGLEIIDVAGDGNCMFHALRMWINKNRELVNGISEEIQAMGDEDIKTVALRNKLQKHAEKKLNEMTTRYFSPEQEISETVYTKYTDMVTSLTQEASQDSPESWGDDNVLCYLVAPMLNIPILVISTDISAYKEQEELPFQVRLYQPDSTVEHLKTEDDFNRAIATTTLVLLHTENHWRILFANPQQNENSSVNPSRKKKQRLLSTEGTQ